MMHNHSHTTFTHHPQLKCCDVCGEQISEGDALFVGVINDGMLVSVANCCRSTLHSVFSQCQYWYPPEEPHSA